MSSYSARYACFRSNAACAVLLRTGPPRSNHCGSLVAPFFVHSDSRLPRLLLLSTNTSGLASGLGSQLRHRALLSLWPSLRNGLSARLRASETQGPSSHAPVSDQTRAVQAALWPRPPCQPRASRGRPQTGRLPRRCVALQLPPTEVARSAELASTLPFVPSAHCRKTACAPGLQAWEDRPGLVAGGLGLGLSSRSGCQNSSLHGSASFTFSYRCSGRALTRKRRQRQLELIIDNRRRTCLRHEAGGLRSAHAPP